MRIPILVRLVLAVAACFGACGSANAQTYTWLGGSTSWNSAGNWSPAGIPNSATAHALFNGAAGSVHIGSSVQTQTISFSNLPTGYTITSSAGQILSSLTTINVGPSTNATINLANVTTGSLLFTGSGPSALTINNDAGGLLIGPSTFIGSPSFDAPGITVTGSGTTIISGSFVANLGNRVTGGLTQSGPSRLTLSGDGTFLSGGIRLESGYMTWDYTTNANQKFGSGNLQLSDGELQLTAHPTIAVTQAVPGGFTTIGGGDMSVVLNTLGGNRAPISLSAGSLSRVSTGTMRVYLDTNASLTTTTGVTNDIIGPWAVVNGPSTPLTWASKSGANLIGLASYGVDTYGPGINTHVTTGVGIPADFTTNTLRLSDSVTAVLSGTNTIQTGGIISAYTTIADPNVISGGMLTTGGGEMIVHTSSGLTINSAMTLPAGLTLSGWGSGLTLGGPIDWVGGGPFNLNFGTATFTHSQAFDSLTALHFNDRSDSFTRLNFRLPDSQNATFAADVRLTGHATYSVANSNIFLNSAANSRITLGGVISSDSGSSAPFFSAGTQSSGFHLAGDNTFTGNLMVGSGTVGISANSNLGPNSNNLVLQSTNLANLGGLEFLTPGLGLTHDVKLALAGGRLVVTGTNTNSVDSVITGIGSLYKTGTGTLVLNGSSHTYSGGTNVNEGRLTLGHGDAIPTNTDVTVSSGAEFNTGGFSNTVMTRPLNVSLNGGTFRAPTDGEYHFTNLTLTGGTVDPTGANFALRFAGAGGITATNTAGGPAAILGSGNSWIQNDTGAPLPILVNPSPAAPFHAISLDIGAVLSASGNNPDFALGGSGTLRITNPANTANINVTDAILRVDDVTTGGFGALGSGTIKIGEIGRSGSFSYGGPSATLTKPLSVENVAILYLLNDGTNLTITGGLTETTPTLVAFVGPDFTNGVGPAPSATFTLPTNNNYTSATTIHHGAVVSIPSLPDIGEPSPIGPGFVGTSLYLSAFGGRGTLMVTGTEPQYSTNRGITIGGFASFGHGGAIGVANPGTNLTLTGQITQLHPGSFIKTGAGTLTLTNTENLQAETIVEQGRLLVPYQSSVIPIGSNVTVQSASTFQVGPEYGANLTARYGTVALNGGTMEVHPPTATSAYLFLNRFVTDGSGGTIQVTSAGNGSGLAFTQTGQGITINGNTSWSGPADFFALNSSAGVELPITIAAGKTLTSDFSLAAPDIPLETYPFRITGGGTLHLTNPAQYRADVRVNQARLRMENLTDVRPDYFRLTLDNGTLAYGGPTQSWPAAFTVGLNGGAIEVINPANTLTLTGAIGNGGGPLIKTGSGTLILENTSNLYSGGIVVNAGRLDVGDDNQLGQAAISVNPAGTVRFTASTATARNFTMFNGSMDVPSGVNLSLDGANVFGGFLRGSGTYSLGGSTSLTGVTTFTNSNLHVTGPASITNFAHNGNLTVASGANLALNYGTNGSAGRMTINGTANVSEFVSNGLLTVPNGGLINNTGSNMVLGGGSTTFVGAVSNLGGKIDLGGQQLIVRGGLLVTNAGSFGSGNGVRNGQTVADFGALIKGTGPYQSVITQNGGQYLPGNSPGTSQVGDFFINPGGNLIFQITDAGPSATFPSAPGTAGTNPGWGLTQVFTSMNFTATPASPYTITMQTQLPPPAAPDTPGLMSSFDPHRSYQWLIFDLQPGAVFNGTFDPAAINFATAQFVNPTAGGTFSLSRTGGQIFLTFTPVPEPAMVLSIAAVGWLVMRRWRRRSVQFRHGRNDHPIAV